MLASKAIQLLQDPLLFSTHPLDADAREAIKLGIEALKSHQTALNGFRYPEQFLLPGETLPERDNP